MRFPILLAALAAFALPLKADTDAWAKVTEAARGQTVYWNAWGGDARTNDFIRWVGEQTEARYGVSITHVKLTDTAEAVTRVIAERAAGQDADGAVDMIWINGANFLSMKELGLLHGPFVTDLPNARFVDLSPGAPASVDFTVPVEGFEAPWRLAKFVFSYDSATVPEPPRSMAALLGWAKDNPGRFTHAVPQNFMGASFLKQALIELTPAPAVLQSPVTDDNFGPATQPLWDWYDTLRPHLWRGGATFPENQSVQDQLLNDGEIDIAMSFDPASTAAAIEQGLLPDTARVFVPEIGSLGNVSFVAIPYNAANREGAMVVANFLLDPATQARQQDITVLGSFSVLDPVKLNEDQRRIFDELPSAPALPTLEALGPTLLEPHGSWMTRIAEEWSRRYTK
ncbi:MAG: ABC transporter substrate-binding protein [Pseudomonadota bacterium]